MRRKYRDCQRADGNCSVCSMVSYGRDCHNNPITKLEWARISAGLTTAELAERSGVNVRAIQKVESGEAQAGNMTARNILAIADALDVYIRELI